MQAGSQPAAADGPPQMLDPLAYGLNAQENQAPVAEFAWSQPPGSTTDVSFFNSSYDPEGDPVTYYWHFGDPDKTSTAKNPFHRFQGPGAYQVSLVVTDQQGRTGATTKTVEVHNVQLVVNSTGDGRTRSPEEGCDTGRTIGDPAVPECTLRAAIEVANVQHGGDGDISFAIDIEVQG